MRIMDSIIAILLFLYAINFRSQYESLSLVFLMIAGISIVKKKQIKKSWQSAFVVLFLFSYYLKVAVGLGENVSEKIIQFAVMYLFGTFLCEHYFCKGDPKYLFKAVFWGATGFGAYGVLCTINMFGLIDATKRIADYWSQSSFIAATQVTAWIIVFIAIVPWVVLQFEKIPTIYKVVTVIIGILSILSIFILASRTGLLVVVLAIILTLYCLVKGKQRKVLNRVVILMCIVFFAFQLNVCGIQDKFLDSNLVLRLIAKSESGGAFQTSRTSRWLYLALHWSECMTGNYYYSGIIGAQIHSILLDLYDQAGIIPFFLLMIIMIRTIYSLVQIQKIGDDKVFIKGIQIWFILMSTVLFTEPVWYYGRAHFIAFVFLMLGVVEHYWILLRKEVREDSDGRKVFT